MKIEINIQQIPSSKEDKIAFLDTLSLCIENLIGVIPYSKVIFGCHHKITNWGFKLRSKEEMQAIPIYYFKNGFLLKYDTEQLIENAYYINEKLVLKTHLDYSQEHKALEEKINDLDFLLNHTSNIKKIKQGSPSKTVVKKSKKKVALISDETEKTPKNNNELGYSLSRLSLEEFIPVFNYQHTIWDQADLFKRFNKKPQEGQKIIGRINKEYGEEVVKMVLKDIEKIDEFTKIDNIFTHMLYLAKKHQTDVLKSSKAKEKRSRVVV